MTKNKLYSPHSIEGLRIGRNKMEEMTLEERKIIAKFCAHCKYYFFTSGCEHINHPSRKPHSECPDYERMLEAVKAETT